RVVSPPTTLCLSHYLMNTGVWADPYRPVFLVGMAAAALAWLKPKGFIETTTLVTFSLLYFGKFMFLNYDWMIAAGLLLCATVAGDASSQLAMREECPDAQPEAIKT
ncbi:MAG TPA: hypothetical protein VGO93_10635, partial [Candidatus Xenobia bacterium]